MYILYFQSWHYSWEAPAVSHRVLQMQLQLLKEFIPILRNAPPVANQPHIMLSFKQILRWQ